mmetsp:Transcript_24542/g.32538  ORF Transcript_24542/g.32538 Transcript_24542/m.32538 type:complete len:170 (-) Transcript_24542:766-1275(-)
MSLVIKFAFVTWVGLIKPGCDKRNDSSCHMRNNSKLMAQMQKMFIPLIYPQHHLRALSTDTTSKLDVLGHDCHTLRVDRAQVGVLKQTNKVCLSSLLKGKNSTSLETKICLEILCNLTNETLEGKLADQKVGGFLVPTDLTKRNGSGAVTVGLLYTSGCWGGFSGCFGC